MFEPRDFSYRKFKRKREQEGLKKTLHASAELATRKLLAPPILRALIEYEIVDTLDREDLFSLSNRVYSSQSGSYVNSSKNLEGSEFVAEIGSGYVLPSTGLALDNAGRAIRETVGPPRVENKFLIESMVWHGFYDSPRVTSAMLRQNTAYLSTYAKSISIACPLSPRFINYYHWMKETVPKIRYVQEYESMADLDVTYLVPSDAPSWLDETLELLDIPQSKIEHANAIIYQVDRLLIPSFPSSKLVNYRWLRNSILDGESSNIQSIKSSNNIYISRQNTIERQVVNEEEVMATLSEYGFESYQLEDNKVEENAVLFNEADIVVGPHGAGLTDIIFCTDTIVVELFGTKVRKVYENLSNLLGLEYISMDCASVSTDIHVNTDTLKKIIQSNHSI